MRLKQRMTYIIIIDVQDFLNAYSLLSYISEIIIKYNGGKKTQYLELILRIHWQIKNCKILSSDISWNRNRNENTKALNTFME